MKTGFLIAILAILAGCTITEPIQKTWPPGKIKGSGKTLNLDSLQASGINYVDLSAAHGTVYLEGNYCGPRIVIRNAKNLDIVNKGPVRICNNGADEKRPEAIVFINPKKLAVVSSRRHDFELNGVLQVWEGAQDLIIDGLTIRKAHTGIRIATAKDDGTYKNILVRACHISETTHEGIYIGPHRSDDGWPEVAGLTIYGNIIERTGWDGIQIGNAKDFEINANEVKAAGLDDEYGQNFALTVNPGSKGYVGPHNDIQGLKQYLESRVFER